MEIANNLLMLWLRNRIHRNFSLEIQNVGNATASIVHSLSYSVHARCRYNWGFIILAYAEMHLKHLL